MDLILKIRTEKGEVEIAVPVTNIAIGNGGWLWIGVHGKKFEERIEDWRDLLEVKDDNDPEA